MHSEHSADPNAPDTPALRRAAQRLRVNGPPVAAAASWAQVSERIARDRIAPEHIERKNGRRSIWRRALAGSAAIALAAICFFTIRTLARVDADHTLRDVREYATRRGQQATIVFPDGSRAVLAPETQLRYGVNNNGTRRVVLRGQAFFTVTPDADHPFIVQARNVFTRVLGTAFDVRYYPSDPAVRVAVVAGKVAAGGRGTPTILTAGTIGQITDSSATVNAASGSQSGDAWTRGLLEFRDTPVPAMLEAIGRWYGYEFRVADSVLAKQAVSGVFSTTRSADALNTIRVVLGVTLTFDDNVVTLHQEQLKNGASRSKTRGTRETFTTHTTEVGK